jgi:hypothetical protein
VGLAPLPASFATTRLALHRIAEQVVATARKPDNEIALICTPGGFGTPPFEHAGRTLQVRVEGTELVVEEDAAERRAAIESVAQAAEVVGPELFPGGMPADAAPFEVDPEAASLLADFFAFGERTLAALIADLSPADEASAINLWPEHFDIAIEAGPESLGRRATYGASPGDEDHPEPYVYVAPWQPQTRGGLWNATSFDGAERLYAELAAAADPDGVVAEFFTARREALAD